MINYLILAITEFQLLIQIGFSQYANVKFILKQA